MRIAIVLNCGSRIRRKIEADKVICCDGGSKWCDVRPDILLGDFDSLERPADFEGELVEHDKIKNASDGELAVRYANSLGADEIAFYGVLGGRYDHTLCNFAIMRLATDLGARATAYDEGLEIHYVRGNIALDIEAGATISILPFGGEATVTCNDALFYPLDSLKLTPSDSRGLSNVALGGRLNVHVEEGDVLIFEYKTPQK